MIVFKKHHSISLMHAIATIGIGIGTLVFQLYFLLLLQLRGSQVWVWDVFVPVEIAIALLGIALMANLFVRLLWIVE